MALLHWWRREWLILWGGRLRCRLGFHAGIVRDGCYWCLYCGYREPIRDGGTNGEG